MRLIGVALATLLLAATAAAQGNPDPEAVRRKEEGNELIKKKEYSKARDQYLAALKVDPNYEDVHYNLGVVYFFRLQDYTRALYHLTTYASLRPDAQDTGQVRSLVIQSLDKIEEAEREAYGKVLGVGTVEALRDFVARYPDSPYASDAKVKIRTLEGYADELRRHTRAIDAAYNDALARGTPEGMEAFLARYPDSPQAEEARKMRSLWAAKRAEDQQALDGALAAGTNEALERFLAERPSSPLAAQAKSRLDTLKAAETAFRIAKESRSAPALEVFLATYAGTPHEAEARTLLEAFTREEAERKVLAGADAAWAAASDANTAERYRAFAAEYPSHPKAAEAGRRAAALEAPPARAQPETKVSAPPPVAAEPAPATPAAQPATPAVPAVEATPLSPATAAEQKAPAVELPPPPSSAAAVSSDWEKARAADTREGYEEFLKTHPTGEEADAARARIEELSPDDGLGVGGDKKRALEKYRKKIQGTQEK